MLASGVANSLASLVSLSLLRQASLPLTKGKNRSAAFRGYAHASLRLRVGQLTIYLLQRVGQLTSPDSRQESAPRFARALIPACA